MTLDQAIWATARTMLPANPKACLRCVADMPTSLAAKTFFPTVIRNLRS